MGEKYKLYCTRPRDIPQDIRFSYYCPPNRYILVYTDKELSTEYIPVPENLLSKMNEEEKEWLFECKKTVNIEKMNENKEEYIFLFENLLDNFEKELKALGGIEKNEDEGKNGR